MKITLRLPSILVILLYTISQNVIAASISDVQKQVTAASAKSSAIQTEIDQLHDEGLALDNQYRAKLAQLQGLIKSNERLSARTERQLAHVDSLNQQLQSVAEIEVEIQPLMVEMSKYLQTFISADLPFEQSERLSAASNVAANLQDVEQELGDKYLSLLEAYAHEADFAKSILVYQGEAQVAGINKLVNFYRLGRVALYYQTLDAGRSAMWSKVSNEWVPLDEQENSILTKAISAVDGVSVPALISLPFSDLGQLNLSQSAKNSLTEGSAQ